MIKRHGLIVLLFFTSCISSTRNYQFNPYDLNEKTGLYHTQKLKDFENSGQSIIVYYANKPSQKEVIDWDYDTINVLSVDSHYTNQYQTIAYTLRKSATRGIVVALYELYSKNDYGVYLYHTPNAHLPFLYQILFKYPDRLVCISSASDKTDGFLSCDVLFKNLDLMTIDMQKHHFYISSRTQYSIKKILNTIASKNTVEWN